MRHNIKHLTEAELLAIQFRIWEITDSNPAHGNWYHDWSFAWIYSVSTLELR
jgi:hypothetical protein